ncbi:BRO1 domain-containing protein, partial [Blyttiomyces helicus]
SLNFEKASVLFNIGALYSQLACAQPRGTSDGIKLAVHYYEQAAGAFQTLCNSLAEWGIAPVGDLQAQFMSALVDLMLAQAQECYWNKA